MNEKIRIRERRAFWLAALFFSLFVVLLALLILVDVAPAGETRTPVGLSGLNEAFFRFTGQSRVWYLITKGLGLLAILTGAAFAVVGLVQWIRGKRLRAVDPAILLLAPVYAALGVLYFLFEKVVVNCRPVLMEGETEAAASFPSSHTLLAVAVFGTAVFAVRKLLRRHPRAMNALVIACCVLLAVAVIGRLLSGVHWFTDVLAGTFLGASLTMLYDGFLWRAVAAEKEKKRLKRKNARK